MFGVLCFVYLDICADVFSFCLSSDYQASGVVINKKTWRNLEKGKSLSHSGDNFFWA